MKTDLYNAEAPLTFLHLSCYRIICHRHFTFSFACSLSSGRKSTVYWILLCAFAFLFNSLALLNLGYQYISKPYERQEIACTCNDSIGEYTHSVTLFLSRNHL